MLCQMWNSTIDFWSALSPQLQAAVISAIAVVSAATLGALAIFFQIGRQARHAIQQNKINEAQKLKLKVYEEIIDICREAVDTEIDLSSYVRNFKMQIESARIMVSYGQNYNTPEARVPELIRKKSKFDHGSISVISVTERWQIIDPRIDIFKITVNVAMYEINEVYNEYFNFVIRLMPIENTGSSSQHTLLPWYLPDQSVEEDLARLTEALTNALMDLGCYIYDMQVEMQNLLVGELFEQRIPPREPIDPDMIVIQVSKYSELKAYFENQTRWGLEKKEIEDNVRASKSDPC